MTIKERSSLNGSLRVSSRAPPSAKRLVEQTKKMNLSNTDLSNFDINELFDYEYLYLRNAELHTLELIVQFPVLRVIDLSSNSISSLNFLESMPNLKHVFVSSSKLESFESIPLLLNLESLNLSSNQISSFTGLTPLPKLRVLNLNSNMLHDYKDFPHLPQLEVLNLIDNSISEMKEFKEISYGLNLKLEKVNGQDLTESEKCKGFKYRTSVAISAREGLYISKDEEDYDVRQRADEHFKLIQRKKTEQTPLRLARLSLVGEAKENEKCRVIPVFELEGDVEVHSPPNLIVHTFTITSESDQVTLQIENCLPIKMKRGEGNEHSIKVLIPTGEYEVQFLCTEDILHKDTVSISTTQQTSEATRCLHTRIRWFRSLNGISYSEIESSNSLEYIPTIDDFGSSLKVEFSCYNDSGLEDELFAVYDFSEDKVQYGDPKCESICIEGIATEGEVLNVRAFYSGGKQGDCVLKWYGPKGKIVEGPTYDLTIDDIGHRIAVEFTPIRKDGVAGAPARVESEMVRAASPEIENLIIVGDIFQGCTIEIDYDYYGGVEGKTDISWFRSILGTNEFEEIVGEHEKQLQLSLDDVGRRLKVQIVPVDSDGTRGILGTKVTEIVRPVAPHLKSLSLNEQSLVQGDTLSLNSEYFGGYEGNSTIEWFRISSEGEIITLPCHDSTYTLTLEDVGSYIQATKTPVRSDGVVGRSLSARTSTVVQASAPRITSLAISGEFVQDGEVKLNYSYIGGVEGASIIQWYRLGEKEVELEDQEGKMEYSISMEDLGKMLKVKLTPVRDDGVQGESSEIVTEVVKASDPLMTKVQIHALKVREHETVHGSAEFYGGIEVSREHKWIRLTESDEIEIEGATQDIYTIQTEDINARLIYAVKGVRSDSESQWAFSSPSEVVISRGPEVSEFSITGDFTQDGTVEAYVEGKYLSGEKRFRWVRVDQSEIEMPLCEGLTYHIIDEDIGCRLRCYFIPSRDEYGVVGEEMCTTSTVIGASAPTAHNCVLSGGNEEAKELTASYEYHGGVEGISVLQWYRVRDDSSTLIPGNSGLRVYTLTADDIGAYIKFECTPVRDDGVIGEAISTITSEAVVPGFPIINNLFVEGDAVEDCKLVARCEYFGGREGASMKRWKRLDALSNPTIAIETNEYTITKQDIGFSISFEYTPIRCDNVKGKVVKYDTEVVQAKPPTVTNVKISGSGQMSTELSVSGSYYGGVEGQSEYVWLASDKRDGTYSPISGGNKNKFQICNEHVGLHVKVQYIPVRSDGVRGAAMESSSAVKVTLDQEFIEMLTHALTRGELSVSGLQDTNKNSVTVEFSHQRTTLKGADRKVIVQSRFIDPLQKFFCPMTQDTTNDTSITFTCKKGTWVLNADSSPQRDRIMLAYRFFLGLAKEDLCRDIFGSAIMSAWKKKKSNLQNEVKELVNVPYPSDIPNSATTHELQKAAKLMIFFRN